MSDIDQPTDFQKLCILFHTVLLKNNHTSTDIVSKETLKTNANAFAYEKPGLIKQLKLTNDSEKMCIEVLNNQEDKTKLKLAFNNPIVSKINFDNLDTTITGFESYIREFLIPSQKECANVSFSYSENVIRPNKPQSGPNNYMFHPNSLGQPNPNFPELNPYFTTGGNPGGNLVGPNADIFNQQYNQNVPNKGGLQIGPTKGGLQYDPKDLCPNLKGGIHNPFGIRYDPIGPFGLFGGPDPDNGPFPDFGNPKKGPNSGKPSNFDPFNY